MSKKEQKIKKKTIIMTIIGILFMLILIIGSTYAYFAVNTTNSTSSTVITGKTSKVGNATLNTLVENLHINLSAKDMAKDKIGNYYATSDEKKDYETNKSAGYYDLIELSLATADEEEDNNIYKCNTKLKITLDTSSTNNMGSVLEAGDVILHTFINGQNTDYDLSEIKSTGSKEIEVEIESIGSNSKNIRGYLEFRNKEEDNQNRLAGKNLEVDITTEGLSCEVTGEAVGITVSRNMPRTLTTFITKNKAVEVNFVDYINKEAEITEDITDTTKFKAGSVMAWVEDGDNGPIVYVGAEKKKIYSIGMAKLFYDNTTIEEVNFDNFIFDRTKYMNDMFSGATWLYYIDATDDYDATFDKWDTSKVNNMDNMFEGIYFLDFDLSSFDTSNVTSMSGMFSGSEIEELNLSNFDTSKVTSMYNMFSEAYIETLDLSNFDTSNVTTMNSMFKNNSVLKKLNLDNWDVSKVSDAKDIFTGTTQEIDLSLRNWIISDSTPVNPIIKNINIGDKTLDLSTWNTSNVTNMAGNFANLQYIRSLDLSNWDTSNVTTMNMMFTEYDSLNFSPLHVIGIENFNTSKVESMNSMFYRSNISGTLDLSNWNTSSLKDIRYIFEEAIKIEKIDMRSFNFLTFDDFDGAFAGTIGGNPQSSNKTIIVKDEANKNWILEHRSDFWFYGTILIAGEEE